MLDFLPHLPEHLKVLFFHGKDDLMISRHEFEIMWTTAPVKEKTAIITSNPHVWNHLKQKEFYKLTCDLFLNLPHSEFVDCLYDKQKLITHEAEQMLITRELNKNKGI